jgi:hypothetical protein
MIRLQDTQDETPLELTNGFRVQNAASMHLRN